MTWLGKWRNQYGSILEILGDSNHRIIGTFTTALKDSGFYGQTLPVFGAHQGECIGLSVAGCTPSGAAVLSFTGVFRDDRLVTLWHLTSDAAFVARCEGSAAKLEKLDCARAITAGSDTFERAAVSQETKNERGILTSK
jgi:Avidin family